MIKNLEASKVVILRNQSIPQLARVRKELGVRQQAIAERLGVNQTQISMWERNKRKAKLSNLSRYCRALASECGGLDALAAAIDAINNCSAKFSV